MQKTRSTTVDLLFVPSLLAILLLGAGLQIKGPDAAAAAKGRQSFKVYCGSCHGADAKGDGPLADVLNIAPTDLTSISEKNGGQFPFDGMRKKIDGREKVRGHGSRDMPVWGDAFKTTDTDKQAQERIDQITHFLWSIQILASD